MSGRGVRDIEGRLDWRMRRRGQTAVQRDLKDELKVQVDHIERRDRSANRYGRPELSLSSFKSRWAVVGLCVAFTVNCPFYVTNPATAHYAKVTQM